MKLNKNLLLISIVILVVITAVLILTFRLTKKKKTAAVIAPKDDKVVFKDTDVSEDESEKAVIMAQRLYDDMKGFNWAGHDNSVYEDLNQFSDRELSIVYYCFNSNFGEDETLTEWLINENFRNHNLTDSIILRLQKLNLF